MSSGSNTYADTRSHDVMTGAPATQITTSLGPHVYMKWHASKLGAITEELEDRLLFEFIGDPAHRDILDVGCGDGTLANAFQKLGGRVVGIDASEAMIKAARQQAESNQLNASFCVGKAEHLPFNSEEFDLVVAKTILCFVASPAEVFDEIAHVLRPGGQLVIGELGKWSPWAAERRIRAWMGSKLWRQGYFRTSHELRSLAEDTGFLVSEIRGAIYYPKFGATAYLLRGFDNRIASFTTLGAAFLAMSAMKH